MKNLIQFLDIDSAARRDAKLLWPIIEPHADQILTRFYTDVRDADIDIPFTDDIVDHLRPKQIAHWRMLFEGELDQQYFNNASLVGIRHCQIGLDPKWHIASYSKIRCDFTTAIFETPLSRGIQIKLVKTLDKYLALDMSLAISSYTSLLID